MREFNVAICDDEQYFLNDIKQHISTYERESGKKLNIYEYVSGACLLEDLYNSNIICHILLLDVEMPQINGVELAKKIREFNKDIVLCFITNYERYALDAYKVEALSYLVKPVKYLELKSILNRAIITVCYCLDYEEAENRYLEVKANTGKVIIDVSNIVYIEKRKNQCIFHMPAEEIACYDSLNNIYNSLNKRQFVYSHQGYIINFLKIKEVKKQVICFSNNIEVPVSRNNYKAIKERHMDKINRLRNNMDYNQL